MEVKPGYRTTEAGVIPDEWEVKELRRLLVAGPKNGYSGRSGKQTRGTPTLTLTATTSGCLVLNSETVKCLEETIAPQSGLLLEPGDVLVQRSNTLELVGTTAVFDGPASTYAYPDLMIRIRFERRESGEWFWRYANSTSGRRYFRSVAAGSTGTMPKITGAKLRQMPVPVPCAREQGAITNALGDVDALHTALDATIAKKRSLKQAAMQQLLTGRTRLPGFQEQWRTIPLGRLAPLQRGFDLTSGSLRPGPYPVVYSNGIAAHHERAMVKGPGVVTGRSGTIGRVTFVHGDYWPHNTALWVTTFNGNEPRFVYNLFESIGLERFAGGSGVPTLNRNDVHSFEVRVPPTPEEQTAIAEVLSNMDAEIAALEARREKTRLLKIGMMQELLTGRTRLV